ncbi:MAG: ribonuclease HII [bacterium JZ-2024 1]
MTYVAGVDEAGRGSIAGPVVAAAVLFQKRPSRHFPDSKALSRSKRDTLAEIVLREVSDFAIVCVSHRLIDSLGIVEATRRAATLAVSGLRPVPATILVDGPLPLVVGFSGVRCIPNGDRTHPEIGAASILAKVARDFLMEEYHLRYPQFLFHRHFGYAAPAHLARIGSGSLSPIHRLTFRSVREVPLFGTR